VERGVPLVRDDNNGISAVVDAFGRIIDGLSLNISGALDSTLSVPIVPKWNNFDHNLNFWLVLGALGFLAFVSRLGFIRRMN
jgi:apolipoprotein N-acyltransferase